MSPQTKNDQEGARQIGYAGRFTEASLQVIFWKVYMEIFLSFDLFSGWKKYKFWVLGFLPLSCGQDDFFIQRESVNEVEV